MDSRQGIERVVPLDQNFVACIESYCRARVAKTSATDSELASWDAFFQDYSAATRRIAEKVGLRGVDLDDCQQEAWAEIFVQLAAGRYDPDRGRLWNWIYTLVRHKAVDILRSNRLRMAAEPPNLDSIPTSREEEPSAAYDRQRRREVVREALGCLVSQLSPVTFQTLYGYWIEEKNCGQMADELGLSLAEIRYRRRRARHCLIEILARSSVSSDLSTG